MERKLTEQDGRQALRDHVIDKATAARLEYGPDVDHQAILRMLNDRHVVRFPVDVAFDAQPLNPGEFAVALPIGDAPSDGYRLFVHPCFEARPDALPLLIAYHLVDVNYGEMATHEEAELFGATLLGMNVDSYYEAICQLADSIPRA